MAVLLVALPIVGCGGDAKDYDDAVARKVDAILVRVHKEKREKSLPEVSGALVAHEVTCFDAGSAVGAPKAYTCAVQWSEGCRGTDFMEQYSVMCENSCAVMTEPRGFRDKHPFIPRGSKSC